MCGGGEEKGEGGGNGVVWRKTWFGCGGEAVVCVGGTILGVGGEGRRVVR